MEQNRIKFVQLHQEYEKKARELESKYNVISTWRILTFLAGFALLAIGVSDARYWLIAGGVFFVLAFCLLVRQHGVLVKEQEEVANRHEICGRYVDRFGDGWRQFQDAGADLLHKDDVVARDIDLLGQDSLYQMISVCHTDAGRRKLGQSLTERYVEPEEVKRRLAAIEELSENREFAIAFEAASVSLSKSKRKLDVEAFEEYCLNEKKGILPAWANVCRFVLPILEFIALVLWVTGVTGYGYFLCGFVLMLAFSWLTITVTGSVIQPAAATDTVIGNYETMLKLIEDTDFSSELLRDMKQKVSGEEGACKAFGQLHGISQAYNISFNPLVHQVLSGLILWDYQVAAKVSRWKKKFGNNVSGCFELLGAVEELLSLSVLAVVRETGDAEVSYDQTAKVRLEGEALFHPLIDPSKVRDNAALLTSGITIITGSNMSGKTTYLRTLAINLVLAYIGAPVCAKTLRASYMKLFTSMRVTDDVAHGISTFYAEILRIKGMSEYRKKDAPMVCLIDEIFKGTNSADRIVGATEVIKGLAGPQCMTIVSTHDFELCNLIDKDGREAVNYHFEEYYEADELKFDYTIKNGRCTSTNARAILRMAGFSVQDA